MGGQIADIAAKLRKQRSSTSSPPPTAPRTGPAEPVLQEASLARV
jgi:hypothetical protein